MQRDREIPETVTSKAELQRTELCLSTQVWCCRRWEQPSKGQAVVVPHPSCRGLQK